MYANFSMCRVITCLLTGVGALCFSLLSFAACLVPKGFAELDWFFFFIVEKVIVNTKKA
jgi:hypothetical protein